MASWLFGKKSPPENFDQYVPSMDDKNEKVGHSMEAYRFDSSALERAAKAAKDLEKSAFASQALELSMRQEETKKQEFVQRAKEIELQIENTKVDTKRVEAEERRRLLQEQAKIDQQKAQYQDQLARKRYDDQLLQQKNINEENLRRQEESVAKQEAMRKATIEHEMETRLKYDSKRKEAEFVAQAKLERETHDLKLEQMKLQAEQDRETTLKSLVEKRETILSSIKTASSVLGMGMSSFLSDPVMITGAVGGMVALTAGYFAAKGSFGVLFRYLEANLARPSLVRETSRLNVGDLVKHPIKTLRRFKNKPDDVLSEVVLSPEIEERVRDIAIGTSNTKRNQGMYRNILLFGPPGTGKTLFAKKLAMHSGMDYAILTGGDVAMLGRHSVFAMHKVFDWAQTSKRGLILFIDEAESFLRKRRDSISEDLRMVINAFLYRTGTQTDKFMVVLASNTPEILDIAVMDRVHEPVKFPLPGPDERERLVRLYFQKFILQPATEGKRRIKVADFDYKTGCSKVAALTEGFSAREISNLALDWQMSTYASLEGNFTQKIMMDRTEAAVQHKKHKVSWYSKSEADSSVFSQSVINAVKRENSSNKVS